MNGVPTLEMLDADALRDTVTTFRDTMLTHQASINRLNVYPVPDGDTGTNMARTLDAVVAEMNGAAEELDPTCDAISYGALMGARGNSGVILSQIMRGIASTLKGKVAAGRFRRRRRPDGRLRCRLHRGPEADRGHDPHRRPRERGRGQGSVCRRRVARRRAARRPRRWPGRARPHS